MTTLDQHDIGRIKDLIKLSHVAGQVVKLKSASPSGDQFIGLCQFHQEKTPSFRVNDSKGFYKCFGCGASGDVIKLVMELDGIGFLESVSRLKLEAGLADDYLTKSQKKAVEAERAKRHAMLASVRKWRQKLRNDLVNYTNAQWRMYRIARRQAMQAGSEELDSQIDSHEREAVRRERALDELDGLSEQHLFEWFQAKKTWEGIKNPPWFLTGWRLEMARGGNIETKKQ